jgi:PGF-CTERM protein
MIRKQIPRRACWLALLVLLAPIVGAIPLASAAPASAPGTQQYAVVQGGECTTVGALGDGSTSVNDHYDYRSPYNSEPNDYSYSSMGTTGIQENQESKLYVYDGADGHSLVMVHDAWEAPGGSTVTFDLSGLPSDGQWAVQDDNYPLKDDDWNVQDGQSSINWYWSDGRTDGGAFLGLNDMGDGGVTIDPGFNQAADGWDYWNSETPSNQEMTGWTFQSSDGNNVALDMSASVTIYQGSCAQNDFTGSLDASLTGPGTVGAGANGSFDASDTAGDASEYQWNFGDGTTTTTGSASTTHAYSEPGVYTASVTASNGDTADAAFVTVVVTSDNNQAPNAVITGPGVQSTEDGRTYLDPNSLGTFSAAASTDDVGIDTYEWDFGDGTTVTTQTAAMPHTYQEPGNYTVSVTATDVQGATDTTTMEVTVVDTLAPSARMSGPQPENVTAGTEVSFSGSRSTDANEITNYNWTLGDGTNATGVDITHTYQQAGNYTVTLSVMDQAGNVENTTQTIEVAQGPTPPVANLSNPGDIEANADVTLDASASSDEGEITTYEWNLDGEGGVDVTTEEPTLTTNLSSPGERTVIVTVTDDSDESASADVQFNVTEEAPPTPAINAPDTITADEQLSVDGSESTDNGEIESYEWSFGDGATATGETAGHSYSSPGSYEVTLAVTDTLGHTATTTHSVTVEEPQDNEDPPADDPDPSPSPSPSPSPARPSIGFADFSVSATELLQGENATVTASFRNTGDAAGTRDVQFTVGNYSETEQIRLGSGDRTNVTFTYTFDEPGNYTMSIGSRSKMVTVTPAISEFNVTDTRVRDQDISVGDAAIVETRVTNTGNVAGNHTLNLMMSDGSIVTKNVSVDPGETVVVTFTPTIDTAGEHAISLGNETYSFSVNEPNTTDDSTTDDPTTSDPGSETTSDPGTDTTTVPSGESSGTTPGFGLVVALVALLAAALVALRSN